MADKNEIKKYSVIDHISKLYVTSYNAETSTITTGSEDDRLHGLPFSPHGQPGQLCLHPRLQNSGGGRDAD